MACGARFGVVSGASGAGRAGARRRAGTPHKAKIAPIKPPARPPACPRTRAHLRVVLVSLAALVAGAVGQAQARQVRARGPVQGHAHGLGDLTMERQGRGGGGQERYRRWLAAQARSRGSSGR